MSELTALIFKTMTPVFEKIIDEKCNEYESNKSYKIHKYYNDDKLNGCLVYHDDGDYRYVDEIHYNGENRFTVLKMYRLLKEGGKKLRGTIQKQNDRLFNVYLRLGFRVVAEDKINYFVEGA